MATQMPKGGYRDFAELNRRFGVRVMSHQNDYGLVKVGIFMTYAAAEEYLAGAKRIAGLEVPTGYNPIWPPRERAPENAWMNERWDKEAKFFVSVRVPELAGRG